VPQEQCSRNNIHLEFRDPGANDGLKRDTGLPKYARSGLPSITPGKCIISLSRVKFACDIKSAPPSSRAVMTLWHMLETVAVGADDVLLRRIP
jgi:hypothetical protein